jgi:hypothetical protein
LRRIARGIIVEVEFVGLLAEKISVGLLAD